MKKESSDVEIPLEIDPSLLRPEVLLALIESFVLREGTDYGEREVSLERKIDQVRKQILSKEVLILFENESESVTLLTRQDYQRRVQSQGKSSKDY